VISLSIKEDFAGVGRALDELEESILKSVLPRSINRTVEQAKTSMSREIREEFNIPAATVNKALRIIKASFRNGRFECSAVLESPTKRGRSMNLIHFSARQTKKGVSFKIRKQGARHVIPGSFLGNQGRTVFIRTGEARLPIKALQTIDVAQMFNTRRINARVVLVVRDKFPEVFARELKYATDKFNARASA
jgi:hypothetical protein